MRGISPNCESEKRVHITYRVATLGKDKEQASTKIGLITQLGQKTGDPGPLPTEGKQRSACCIMEAENKDT
jgi:hypothetical protein